MAADAVRPDWARAASGLADRVLGEGRPPIEWEGLEAARRSFAYRCEGGPLTVRATDGVAAAVGLHTYLRRVCSRSVGWDTPLPLDTTRFPDAPLTRGDASIEQTYYLNFCTYGYTSTFWGWADWEREIDWMALHGVTAPLSLVGHEAVLREAYTRLGLDDETVRAFLGGPSYLPWQYMGNLDGFAGPLPSDWIDTHLELGRRILERQRAFGMRPVLPSFTGHVPPQLAPERTTPRTWHGFVTEVLSPSDPLYARLAEQVTRCQIDLLGTDHRYAADPFIEMPPVETDPAYPGTVAGATLAGLTAADPEAVWVLQAWPFSYQRDFWSDERVRAFLDSIPDERLLVLDLWAEADPQWERFDAFSGKPWMWCSLLNFGGRTDPIGDLQGAVDGLNRARRAPTPPVGVGLAMEATHNNTAFFELVADQAWNPVEDVARDWLPGFVEQRYGPDRDPALLRAWQGLNATVYGARGVRIFPEQFNGVLALSPGYGDLAEPERLRADVEGLVWYDPAVLHRAWADLVEAAERDPDLARGPLGHDLVEVATAVLARVADRLHLDLVEDALREGAAGPERVERFLGLFTDLEALLATRPEFTFREWEEKAASWGGDADECAVMVDNARRLLTVWDTPESPFLDDYAGRLWSGLVGGYYRDRWRMWAEGLDAALSDREGAEARLEERLQKRAARFLDEGPEDEAGPGGVVERSRALLDRYGDPR
ncbi:alpha-N-acetylglucosaminidase C-terminal domain-containing protein [Nocardiopsis sp. HNM0947]|uniref:Alpha-N-acetylglucosaminidase C-terminal domain-containing protein n=1 Tax=Nocardiopsis coralli TaxID=2772213 RepID=A0ABR9P525_9ACTN|nr:alpha-N-acetylglucosaminidase [Nocardiopsis coralli]MBE2998917.1 alpha-N-acetylglucosaminidase C-terminal domain-containing protein [Nocardiopsis coralli]